LSLIRYVEIQEVGSERKCLFILSID
jgi:hypothetical protein